LIDSQNQFMIERNKRNTDSKIESSKVEGEKTEEVVVVVIIVENMH